MILELDDDDALRLLALARRELHQAYPPWRSYWERLSQNLQRSIERATMDLPRAERMAELEVDKSQLI